MAHEPYLIRLATRLADGARSFDSERRARHRAFILSRRQSDGGFNGREGDSDLYYTSFAVRGLSLLGTLDAQCAAGIGGFLKAFDPLLLSVVDLVSWLSAAMAVQLAGGGDILAQADSDWSGRIASRLESVRVADGGYAKNSEGAAGSTYHSFLVALCYELIGRSVPEPKRLIQFVYDRQRDDGGFVEIAPMKRGGTNPTAAAAALLTMLGGMDDELNADIAEFLRSVRSSEGGLQANTRIPFADGLSTFTGLLTIQDLGLEGILEQAQVGHYVASELEFPTGGFRGASWDEQADVEYTFYGLGVLALLAEAS
jgi:geranylgeranyl transferase type-2 subunit beta